MRSLPLLSPAALSLRAPEQLSLPGILPVGPPTDGLFFALFPPPPVAASLAYLAARLRAKHGLHGAPLATDRFHVTLHHFGNYHGLRQDFVEKAGEAAAKIANRSFHVAFDRVMSFAHGTHDNPLVIRMSGRNIALRKFQRDLGVALSKTGLGRKITRQFTPHVTLLYDRQQIAEQRVEPIGWEVNEFVLVHSLLGQTQHIPLGRWPLRAPRTKD